jgi:hypothetical protein
VRVSEWVRGVGGRSIVSGSTVFEWSAVMFDDVWFVNGGVAVAGQNSSAGMCFGVSLFSVWRMVGRFVGRGRGGEGVVLEGDGEGD